MHTHSRYPPYHEDLSDKQYYVNRTLYYIGTYNKRPFIENLIFHF